MTRSLAKRKIAEFSRLLYESGYVTATEGNISIRIAGNRVLISPSGYMKRFISYRDIVEIDMNGNPVKGNKNPASERFTHLEIYAHNPEIKAVVHSHPEFTVLSSALNRDPFSTPFLSEAAMFLSGVKYAPFASPSTKEGASVIRDVCKDTRIIIIEKHGIFTYGVSIEEAFSLTELTEKVARMDFFARLSGDNIKFLSKEEILALSKVDYKIR
jgi:L-fuculose-phosphate aldolase